MVGGTVKKKETAFVFFLILARKRKAEKIKKKQFVSSNSLTSTEIFKESNEAKKSQARLFLPTKKETEKSIPNFFAKGET